jgi:flagellar FliL protein
MADKTETAPAKEEGAAAAPAASGGLKAWLPLIIVVVLMPALAFGMTKFVLLPSLQKGLGVTPSQEEAHEESESGGHGGGHSSGGGHGKAAKAGEQTSVALNKLLVNVAGTMGARYLLISVSVVSSNPKLTSMIEKKEAQLKDMACGALATKTLADLEKAGARNLIRSELISGFNTILGDALVEDIYFTEFAIQ